MAGALDTWTEIPPRWLAIALGLYVAKDFVMFPFVRKAYEYRAHDASEALVGASARVVVALAPRGWVQLGSERWRAELDGEGPALEVGEEVEVCDLRGHTLLVRRPPRADSTQGKAVDW